MKGYWLGSATIIACLLLTQTPSRSYTTAEIVKQAKPAVVEIVALDEKGSPSSLGTGFFIHPDGIVLTNCHVIQGASSLAAFDIYGGMFKLEVVLTCSSEHDLALVKFATHGVPFLRPRNSGPVLAEGDKVIVIGNPSGLTGTVSEGIISAFREGGSIIQITAPISPGSSGSPVLDENGELIGIATSQKQEGQNLNFAIAAGVVADVMKSGYKEFEKQQAAIAKQQEEQKREEEQKGRDAIAEYLSGVKFLAENAKKPGVYILPSGLQYKIIKAGNGPKPKDTDIVETNYRGTTIEGKEFDSSAKHGGSFSSPVNGLIKGWAEALKMMPVGSKWILYIPSELAYGFEGNGDVVAPGETLIFEIELLGIKNHRQSAPLKSIKEALKEYYEKHR